MLKYDLDKMLYVIPADKHSPEEVSGILERASRSEIRITCRN